MSEKAPPTGEADFEANVDRRLQALNDRQDSIQTMSLWIIHHKAQCTKIASAWLKALRKAKPAKRLTLFYLVNDVLQNCKRKNAKIYLLAFKAVLKDAVVQVRGAEIQPKIQRILSIWEERSVYVQDFIAELKNIMAQAEDVASNVDMKFMDDFKPSDVASAITTFKSYEEEVALRHKQLAQVRLDASSVEAIGALKDRTHSKQFAMQFEESCVKMEEFVCALEKELKDRAQLIELLDQSQLFYETQWSESKIVANAYKNFGIRVKNFKKRLDEYKVSLDDPLSSPVPLPVLDAPSPGNTPPPDPLQDNVESIDMDLSEEESDAVTNSVMSISPVKIKFTDPFVGKVSLLQGDRTASSTVATSSPSTSAIVTKVGYDPRQAYNPAHHMQPRMSVVSSSALQPEPALMGQENRVAAAESREVPATKLSSANDVSAKAALSVVGVPPPVTSAAPASIPPSASTAMGIQFLSKLINQAGASSSQSSSVLESLTSFAQTVKALTAVKKEEQPPQPPTSWSDWKKKKLEEEEAKGGPAQLPQRGSSDDATNVFAWLSGGVSAAGTLPSKMHSLDSSISQSRVTQNPPAMAMSTFAPLAPPPMPAFLKDLPGLSLRVPGSIVPPPLPASLPPPLPPLPPSSLPPSFDQPLRSLPSRLAETVLAAASTLNSSGLGALLQSAADTAFVTAVPSLPTAVAALLSTSRGAAITAAAQTTTGQGSLMVRALTGPGVADVDIAPSLAVLSPPAALQHSPSARLAQGALPPLSLISGPTPLSGSTMPAASLPASIMAVLSSGSGLRDNSANSARHHLKSGDVVGGAAEPLSKGMHPDIVAEREEHENGLFVTDPAENSDQPPRGTGLPAVCVSSEEHGETGSANSDESALSQSAATPTADEAEDSECYPIQSLASIRKVEPFERRGNHPRRDHRRHAFGGQPFPPDMVDYGGQHFGGGSRSRDFDRRGGFGSSSSRRHHFDGRGGGGMQYGGYNPY